MRVLINLVVVLAAMVLCPAAFGQISFCNYSPLSVNVAVAGPGTIPGTQQRAFVSKGWYRLKPFECEDLVQGPLAGQDFYYYGETPGGKWDWSGNQLLCVSENAFTIANRDCAESALRKFRRIDTSSGTAKVRFDCPPCLDSQFVNTLKMLLPVINGIANLALPAEYRTNEWHDVGGVDVQGGLSRGLLSLNVKDNQISISGRIYYWLAASSRSSDSRTMLGSCGVNEARPWVDVTVTSAFGITPEGRLVAKTWTNLDWGNPCRVTILNIDVTPFIQQLIEPLLNELTKEIDSDIGRVDVSQFMDRANPYAR